MFGRLSNFSINLKEVVLNILIRMDINFCNLDRVLKPSRHPGIRSLCSSSTSQALKSAIVRPSPANHSHPVFSTNLVSESQNTINDDGFETNEIGSQLIMHLIQGC